MTPCVQQAGRRWCVAGSTHPTTARGTELYTQNRDVARRQDCKSFPIRGLREQILPGGDGSQASRVA